MKETLGVAGIIFGVVLGIALIVAVGWGVTYFTAGIRGRISANEQIQSGSNRIAQYDHFFNLCAAVQGQEGTIAALNEQLSTATDDKERSFLGTSITGVRGQRSRSIAQYNADARKNYTAGQFRDSDLPFQLLESAEVTSCGGF